MKSISIIENINKNQDNTTMQNRFLNYLKQMGVMSHEMTSLYLYMLEI